MKKGLILFFVGLMALGIVSCGYHSDEQVVEPEWDTLKYKQEITKQNAPGIAYDINVVLPKEISHSYADIRMQLLPQLFALPIISDGTDSIDLDITDAQGCLTAYLKQNKRVQDEAVANIKAEGMDVMQYEMHWENNIELKPIMVNGMLVTFMLNYYSFAGGAHGIHGTNYMTFDVRTGEQIHDKEIFREGTQVQLDKLLHNSLIHYCELNKEAGLTPDDFDIEMLHTNDNYYLTSDSIYYTYNVYEIAPYAYGSHTLGFSAKEALPYLNKESLVYNYWKL